MKTKINSKKIGTFTCMMLVISLVIGMGIFKTPIEVAKVTQNPFFFIFLWFIVGIISICGGLTFAEIGSRLPKIGGFYEIFSLCYNPTTAFAFNISAVISNAASVGGIALIASEYISLLLNIPLINSYQIIIAISIVILLFLINLLGLIISAKFQVVLGSIKIIIILFLILPIFFNFDKIIKPFFHLPNYNNQLTFIDYFKSFGYGIIPIIFTFSGYQQVINFGGEIKNPKKTFFIGIGLGMIVAALLYILVNISYIGIIGIENLKNSKGIVFIMAVFILGNFGKIVICSLLFLSALGYINASLLNNPRVLVAMGNNKTLPAFFSKFNSKNSVPIYALSLYTLTSTIIIFFAEKFEKIMNFSVLIDCLAMLLGGFAIFILRKSNVKPIDEFYKIKLYPLIPLIYNIFFILVIIFVIYKETFIATIGVCIILIIALLFNLTKYKFYVFKRRRN